MTKLFIFALLILSTSVLANTLPEIPSDCFDEDVYCTRAKVIRKVVGGESRKVINVKVFAVVSFDDYESVDELMDLFFDFNSWDEYAANEGSGRILFNGQTSSQHMGYEMINGFEVAKHYAHYRIKSPIGYIKVRAMGYYWMVNPYEGAVVSAEFHNQTTGVYEIPGEDTLYGGEGFKYTAGDFHVTMDEDNEEYFIIFNADVVPSISILPSVAKKPILGGFESLLKGMLDL